MNDALRDDETLRLLTEHVEKYPKLQARDLLKFLYQSSFGCEHAVTSVEDASEGIRKERSTLEFFSKEPAVDLLDGGYGRVSLSYGPLGLSEETLGKLFVASAKKEPNGQTDLIRKLNVAERFVREHALSFSWKEFKREAEAWKDRGYPAIRHSEVFRETYRPAYRVIAKEFLPFLPLFSELDSLLSNGAAIVSVDGGSASGKTTLSELLFRIYGCTVFHMDDFFLRPGQRSAERYAEIGGNVDRERFLEEVLLPLKRKEAVCYRKFDCSSMKLSKINRVIPQKLTVVEGVYSMHPELAPFYDFSVFLKVSPETQRKRISIRNSPEIAAAYTERWIPLENAYFENTKTENRCDLVLSIL